MTHMGLISCVKSKLNCASPASELYTSALFRKARTYVNNLCDQWFILSAEYGLLAPDKVILPYERTLNAMNRNERQEWAKKVFTQLSRVLKSGDKVTMLAGIRYREFLKPMLDAAGISVNVPLLGKSIGHQLHWLGRQMFTPNVVHDVERFYSLLQELRDGLGGLRVMRDCHGGMEWPPRGVYYFFEPDEHRLLCPDDMRVVRVGTHGVSSGSNSTLWTRLRTHRGVSGGSGNHRSSIFRLHVGAAIVARSGGNVENSKWGTGQSSTAKIRTSEEPLERQVSEHIGRMSVLWLAISDDSGPASDRAYIERNSIGLLACSSIDPPSAHWLGNYSPNTTIRSSGLWNLDHIEHRYDPRFLDTLETYVKVTIGRVASPASSIAPYGWHSSHRGGSQLALFGE